MSDIFERARAHFASGNAAFEAGRLGEAEAEFAASLALLPDRVSTLVNLAATRIRLGRPSEALVSLEQALGLDPADAEAWSHQGAALADLGSPDRALDCHDRALAIDPRRPGDVFRRGIALNLLQRHEEALAAFDAAIALQPDVAEAGFRRGQTLQLLDRHDAALAAYERALQLDPAHVQAWSNRGGILRDAGRIAEATTAYEQAIAHGDAAEAELNRYFLAAVSGRPAPGAPPAPYVAALFDGYADGFDAHLLGALGYRAHRVLVDGLAAAGERRYGRGLDLGCGTGLCGPLVRPRVDVLEGVDLAGRMLEKACALQVYDRLVQADLVEHLRAGTGLWDLILAADVFIYVGALEPVFAAVAAALRPGGVFCFSVERGDGEAGFDLRPSLRYAHAEAYLLRLAAEHGLACDRILHEPIRNDQQRPVPGLFVYLSAP